jgi:hypothetical protein
MSECLTVDSPYICDCVDYIDKLFYDLDENIYNKKSTTSNLYNIFDMYNRELCEAWADLIYTKNDIYIGIPVTNEMVVHRYLNGIDCLANWGVAEIVSVGNTPGASDYVEHIDYIRHPRGIQWGDIPRYYGSYPYGYGYGYGYGYAAYGYNYSFGQYYNPYAPCGRREPVPGDVYYVTYKYGCRDENLYNNFGALVLLEKNDNITYAQYRDAIRALILAYLGGPTIANIKSALSVFHPENLIRITEYYTDRGWILGENILYSEESWADPSIDTSDGTLLLESIGGVYEWSVTFYESWRLSDAIRDTLEQLIDDMKPAHTKVYVFFL